MLYLSKRYQFRRFREANAPSGCSEFAKQNRGPAAQLDGITSKDAKRSNWLSDNKHGRGILGTFCCAKYPAMPNLTLLRKVSGGA